MAISFYNTLSRKKEEFKPLKKDVAEFYGCGPTVYDYVHIGNLRAFVVYDLIRRVLELNSFRVRQIINITDVDDKTIKKSRQVGKTLKEYTRFYETAFFDDICKLNILPAEKYPRATEHIKEMIALIQKLLDQGFAYKAEDGIYFSIKKFKDYGKFAKVNVEELEAGKSGRVKADEYEKSSVHDFALWKFWSEDDGDVFWQAPFGKGRPGWHIECSAMSMKYLGETIDIHAGGEDLVFPHHQNEIAQSEAATGKKFVNFWLHNRWLLVNGKKMSKSLNNFYTLRDIEAKGYEPAVVRYYLLATHYRQTFNFTFEALDSARAAVQRIRDCYDNLALAGGKSETDAKKTAEKFKNSFRDALNDDLDVSKAIAVLFDFVKDCNTLIARKKISSEDRRELRAAIEFADSVFGVLKKQKPKLSKEQKKLLDARKKARKDRDWEKADKLRDELSKKGIIVEDTSKGQKWKKA